eukprot:scaffold40590_cov37-Cyclotella_meneghiniana.AAC.2
MRVKGFGWVQFDHAWSKGGRKYSGFELAKHLQKIIKEEKKIAVPNEPPLIAPQRVSLSVLGTQSSQVESLDAKYLSDEANRFVGSAKIGVREVCILSCSHSAVQI